MDNDLFATFRRRNCTACKIMDEWENVGECRVDLAVGLQIKGSKNVLLLERIDSIVVCNLHKAISFFVHAKIEVQSKVQ